IDEAMSTIDSESIKILSERLITLSNKATIIYVSHSMINKELIDNSRAIYIEKGELSWENIQS
ncbi:ABC transporter ATP-binding protein, partial [Aeribacillus composti]|nr:ABC transporter ATP-binding protein [Aeribacillus composti]